MNIKREGKQRTLAIFVGGLANTVTNSELYTYFTQFGRISLCEIQTWRNNPLKCRGFATIEVDDELTFNRILSCSHKLGDRVIECKKMITDKTELDSHSKDQLQKKVFVSGLSKKVDDEQFKAFFSQYGKITMAYVVKHHKDKKSKGFGFICFESKKDRDNLLSIKDLYMDGKRIVCSEYSTKLDLKKNTIKSEQESAAQDYSTEEITFNISSSSKISSTKQIFQASSGTVLNNAGQLDSNYRFNRQSKPILPARVYNFYSKEWAYLQTCSPSTSSDRSRTLY